MGYEVVYHSLAEEYIRRLKKMAEDEARRCLDALEALRKDPFRRRSGADIKPWKGPQYDCRLRVGRHRFGYRIDKRNKIVHVLNGWFK